MALTYRILGQASPLATTETLLYKVSAVSAVVSSLIVCNRAATQTSFRIAVVPNGITTANSHYIYYDLLIGGNDTFIATIGVTLKTNDVIRVYSNSANLSFSVYGSEIN